MYCCFFSYLPIHLCLVLDVQFYVCTCVCVSVYMYICYVEIRDDVLRLLYIDDVSNTGYRIPSHYYRSLPGIFFDSVDYIYMYTIYTADNIV